MILHQEHPTRAFEAFNARFLSSEEVARTFVPPPQYQSLIESNHSILLGPRGSGKTTLLKMLQLKALAAWVHPQADEIRDRLPFHSIFLGTDVLWGAQLESRTATIEHDEKRSQIRRTSFRIHLSLALLNAVTELGEPSLKSHAQMKRFTYDISPLGEGELARALAGIWQLELQAESLLGVRVALRRQLGSLLSVTSALRSNQLLALPEFANLDPIESFLSGIDLVDAVIGQPDRKWALLCDELEIAPSIVRTELFQLLRSTAHNILFKFSMFPYSSEVSALLGPQAATGGNDYAPLDLSYGKRESAYMFCESLLDGMITAAGGTPSLEPQDVLGDGWFDGGRRHRRVKVSPYAAPNGEFYRRAERLRRNDPSFQRWLKQNHIDLLKVSDLGDNEQAPFRKALPYILTRSEYLRPGGRTQRSRKSLSLYSGAYSLFSLTEGNPRLFINLMRPLVMDYVDRGGTIPAEIEASSAEITIHRFRASLSAIPSTGPSGVTSVLQLVEVIGDFLQSAQLDEEFSAEPPGTIIVDRRVEPELIELVGRAVNAGALVRMTDELHEGVSPIEGSRLRLAYTLAPEYKLPLVAGRSINLSTIMGAYANARRRGSPAEQASLPFGVQT